MEQLAVLVLTWLSVVSLALVAVMAIERAGDPGYDFRYFWLAGKLWADGVSPYGPIFAEAGARLITEGHIPEIWPYPPNLWMPAIGLSPFSLNTAWHIWLVFELAALLAASAVLALGLPASMIPGAALRPRLARLALFCLHLMLVAALEATHLAVYVGQSALFVYLGTAMLVAGLARSWRGLAVAGLVLVFMKPQVGAAVAIGLIMSGRAGFRILLTAALVSVLLIVPPMMVKGAVVLDWLGTLGDYDGVTLANMAVAMTGIRHLVWIFGQIDIGNIPAMGITLAVGVAVALRVRAAWPREGADAGRVASDLVVAEILVLLAFAPLHMYDFVLFGIGVLAVIGPQGPRLAAAVLAAAVFVKPTDIFVALSGVHPSSFFPGSTFTTVGALILLLVVLTRRSTAD
ncbi:hypothetical protein DEA8626_00476 [Defluviimonas aquaemixtae]|uniref:DUF2029 domain-containing protein n=1 Tax=Albidovulum aquaemixtae TaxID=1542388 RepID=A0A2R8B329_9RHOB|nr:glycosyltransferase 87 family protein [Defluviimonas aquaemixtae]SPH16962.1 hypothetical protein DEA8626_00476 [Defluviimonas aquaemixtae]